MEDGRFSGGLMKRVMLDTNVYEFMVKEIDIEALQRLAAQKEIVIYGNEVIRKELRDIPKKKIGLVDKKLRRLRSALLGVYDFVTGKRSYSITPKMHLIAEKYYIAYRAAGGSISKEKIMNDFLIVSSASVLRLDIVVSEDVTTMLSDAALRAYSIVNKVESVRTPNFIRFESFLKEIRRYVS